MVTTMGRARGLLVAAVAVMVCAGTAVPAAAQEPARADPVPTVFFGDSHTADFGIAPSSERGIRPSTTASGPRRTTRP